MARTGFEELDAGLASFDANDSWSSGTPRQTVSFVDDLRIPLSSGLLVELLTGIYYAMLVIYIVSQKKTSPTFLAITRKALSDFHNIWQKYY